MIKVLIVDDQMIVCEGLEMILSSDHSIEVVGIANNGLEAIEKSKIIKARLNHYGFKNANHEWHPSH